MSTDLLYKNGFLINMGECKKSAVCLIIFISSNVV